MPRACPEYRHLATITGANFILRVGVGETGRPRGPAGLVQAYQATYQRQVETIYDLSSNNIYIVEGQPQGQIQVNRVLGPIDRPEPEKCGDGSLIDCECLPQIIELSSGEEACDNGCGGRGYRFLNAYQSAFSLQGQVQDKVVRYSAAYSFTHVESV